MCLCIVVSVAFLADSKYILSGSMMCSRTMVHVSGAAAIARVGFGRKDFSRIFMFEPPDVLAHFIVQFSSHFFLWGKILQSEVAKKSVSTRPAPNPGKNARDQDGDGTPSDLGWDLDGPGIGPRRGSGWHPPETVTDV